MSEEEKKKKVDSLLEKSGKNPQEYVARNEHAKEAKDGTLTVGRYRGQTYEHVLQKDIEYVKSLHSLAKQKKDLNTDLMHFLKYAHKRLAEQNKFNYGKHFGKSFQTVIETDIEYRDWALATWRNDPHSASRLQPFVDFILDHSN